MADENCPNCGAALPREAGQHALAPAAGVVECPSCGETVTIPKPGAAEGDEEVARDVPTAGDQTAREGEDSFAGEETIPDVMREVRDKEGG